MRGGAFFNGKEGRVDFRKNLRVREDWWVFERPFFNGKEGRVGFRRTLKVQGSTGRFFEKTPSAASFIKKEKIIYNVRCEHYKLFFLQHQCHTLNTGSLSASAG